jgi:hypothetical protein
MIDEATEAPTPPSPALQRLRGVIAEAKAEKQAIREERYEDVEDETEEERHHRIMHTRAAWN